MNKLILLIPALLLTACGSVCNVNVKTGPYACASKTPQEARRDTRVILGTPVRTTPASADLMGENSTLATPDTHATAISAIATANSETFAAQQALTAANNANHAIDARIAEANAATARDALRLAQEQNRGPVALEETRLKRVEAENKAAALQAEIIRAQTEQQQGTGRIAATLALCAVILGFILLMYKAMTRPHVSYKVTRPDFSHAQGNTSIWTARECPPGVSEEQMIVIAHGRQSPRNDTGLPLTRRNWLHVVTRDKWDGMIAYLMDNEYATQAHTNAPVSITPKGDEYFYQFEQLTPLPDPTASPTT